MIETITVSNFKTIKSPITIDFSNHKVFNVVFGKNNSGKSTIIESIKLFKEMFLTNTRVIPKSMIHEELKYVITFRFDDKLYQYTVALDSEKSEIVYEAFEVYKKNTFELYFRRVQHDIELYSNFQKLFTKIDFERLKTYIYDLKFNKKELILSNLIAKDFSDSKLTTFLDKSAESIRNITFVTSDEDIFYYTHIDYKNYPNVLSLLQTLDTKIQALSYRYIELDELRSNLNRHRYDHFMDTFRNKLSTTDEFEFFVVAYNQFYRLKGRSLDTLKIQTIDVKFIDEQVISLSDVSMGLKRLIVLTMILLRNKKGDLVLVDDLTNHLDSNTSKTFLTTLHKLYQTFDIKLLFTTHDLLLFDSKLFPLNEIVYVKKDYETKFTYLSAYNIRKDKKILNLYLEGYFEE